MAIVLWLFLLFACLYHVIVTVLVYGIGLVEPETIVVLREGIRFLILITIALVRRKQIWNYLKTTWKLRMIFLMTCILAFVISFLQGKTNADIMIGAKYGLQFFAVFLTAIFLGQAFASLGETKLKEFLRRIFILLVGIIIAGLVWQIGKMIWPDLFYQIGYAPFGDRVFGKNPPLYYLTGPGGYPRLSGIFSGPNNYGYLFVGLFGFWWRYINRYVKQRGVKFILWLLFSASVLGTMSRGAILGIFLQLIALAFVLFHAKRKTVWGLIIAGIVVVGALSLIKWKSTIAHVSAKFGSLSYVWANPWGYGLGSSGPSIHTGHGSILPENFFMQILIDIGIPGLILWLLFRYLVLRDVRTMRRNNSSASPYSVLLMCLSFGFLGMLLEGMFLHVFEDSMVNYRFFMLRGIVYGYVIHTHKSRAEHE